MIHFATCERKRALEYIETVYPSAKITDTPDSAGPLLDLVEKDFVRIQDPMMYGNRIQVIPGKRWIENKEIRQTITNLCQLFHDNTIGKIDSR